MQEIKSYKCDFCSRIRVRAFAIRNHELECLKNPNCKNCLMCKFAVKGGTACDDDGEEHFSKDDAFCTKHNQFLFVLRINHITAKNCSDYIKDSMYYNRDL